MNQTSKAMKRMASQLLPRRRGPGGLLPYGEPPHYRQYVAMCGFPHQPLTEASAPLEMAHVRPPATAFSCVRTVPCPGGSEGRVLRISTPLVPQRTADLTERGFGLRGAEDRRDHVVPGPRRRDDPGQGPVH